MDVDSDVGIASSEADGTGSGAAGTTGADAVVGPTTGKAIKPKKADFRQRAHCNPLSDFVDRYPISPEHVDWSAHYPQMFATTLATPSTAELASTLQLNTADAPINYPCVPVAPSVNGRSGPQVRFLDVGCGFGGLLISLGPQFPDKLMLGLEIREQVTNYVGQRIRALRRGAEGGTPSHHNCSVLRTNAMKFLPNYFRKGQLDKMFFCFPDPHFKKKNFRRRIINHGLLSLYAYCMAPGALLYHATDVIELHEWMEQSCRDHPLFVAVPKEEQEKDPCVAAVCGDTEEAKRVKNLGRFGHDVHLGVFRRVAM